MDRTRTRTGLLQVQREVFSVSDDLSHMLVLVLVHWVFNQRSHLTEYSRTLQVLLVGDTGLILQQNLVPTQTESAEPAEISQNFSFSSSPPQL